MINSLAFLQAQLPFQAYFALVGLASVSDEAVNSLSRLEKQELNSLTNDRRRKEFITSRLELQRLALDSEISDRNFSIRKDKYGCPYGTGMAEHYFVSIAHTEDKVFCAFSADTAIGIDLEPADRRVPKQLKRRIIHPDEGKWVHTVEAIRLWTIKEAYIKLRGKGLRLNMNEVCIQRINEQFLVEEKKKKTARIRSFQVKSHWLAVAYYQ